tara:strand:- start:21521 stop:22015 length:495 start_codon:yes stop_codon:yes gene_type:complete
MAYLLKLPLRMITSVFLMPFLWLRYVLTGKVSRDNQEVVDAAPLIQRLNGLQFQNAEMKTKLDSLLDVLSYHKSDIAERIEANAALDEHEKSFCLDLASSIEFLKKAKDSEAFDVFLKRMSPALKMVKTKTTLTASDSALLERCQSGDLSSFFAYFSVLVTRSC